MVFGELRAIVREWKHQGQKVGSRPIIFKMPGVRVRLIRDVVAELKRRKRRRARAHTTTNRVTVVVNKHCVFGVLDAAKIPRQEGCECIVYRDRKSLRTEARESDKLATRANDTLIVLNDLKKRGRLPLVIGTDNGSTFTAREVEIFMLENKVVHLKSLPRVPQHNGSAENAVGDIKSEVKDGATLEKSCQILNNCRVRQSLNWKTPTEIDQENFEPCTDDDRTEFYNAANTAINLAVLGMKSAKEKRKAEREAIFQTMEGFSLITRIRGHRRA